MLRSRAVPVALLVLAALGALLLLLLARGPSPGDLGIGSGPAGDDASDVAARAPGSTADPRGPPAAPSSGGGTAPGGTAAGASARPIPEGKARLGLRVADAVTDTRLGARVRVGELSADEPAGGREPPWTESLELHLEPGTRVRIRLEADGYFPAEGIVPVPQSSGEEREVRAWLLPRPVPGRGVVRGEEGNVVYEARVAFGRPPRAKGWEAHDEDERTGWAAGNRLGWSAVPSAEGLAAWGRITSATARTETDGTYALDLIPGLQTRLSASHRFRYYSNRSAATIRPASEPTRISDISLGGGGAAALVVALARDRGSAGTIHLAAFLHAVDGGRVYAREIAGVTEFEMWGLPPGAAELHLLPLLRAVKPARVPVELRPEEVARAGVTLEDAPMLRGSVADVNGRPVPRAVLLATFRWPGLPEVEMPEAPAKGRASNAPSGEELSALAAGSGVETPYGWEISGLAWFASVTDGRGAFVLEGLPEGGADLVLSIRGATRWRGRGVPGEAPLEIRLAESEPDLLVFVAGASWGGEVALFSEGRAVETARLGVPGAPAAFRGLRSGRYAVLARERGLDQPLLGYREVTVGGDRAEALDIALAPAGVVTLRASEAETGAPVRAALECLAGGIPIVRLDLREGEAEVALPPRTAIRLTVSAEGLEPWVRDLALEPGERLTLGEIRLRRAGSGK
ncbi:MAG: hypothetical protein L0216_14055 [Planctomycetales bacterium]|nr:hypothetical protein [Planctomycetales bacterium]